MVSVCMCSECGTKYEGFEKYCPECNEVKYSVIQIQDEEYQEEFCDKD